MTLSDLLEPPRGEHPGRHHQDRRPQPQPCYQRRPGLPTRPTRISPRKHGSSDTSKPSMWTTSSSTSAQAHPSTSLTFSCSRTTAFRKGPEPTAIENAYRVHRERLLPQVQEGRHPSGDLGPHRCGHNAAIEHHGIRTPFDLIERAKQMEQEVGRSSNLEVLKFKPKLIVNQVRTKNDIQIGSSMKSSAGSISASTSNIWGTWNTTTACGSRSGANAPRRGISFFRPARCIERIVHNLLRKEQLTASMLLLRRVPPWSKKSTTNFTSC